MQQVSTTLSDGRVERLRFMNESREEVLAPCGIIRRDESFADRVRQMEQRRDEIRQYSELVGSVRSYLDQVKQQSRGQISEAEESERAANVAESKTELETGAKATTSGVSEHRNHASVESIFLGQQLLPCCFCGEELPTASFLEHTLECQVLTETAMRRFLYRPKEYLHHVPDSRRVFGKVDANGEVPAILFQQLVEQCLQCANRYKLPCLWCNAAIPPLNVKQHVERCSGGKSADEIAAEYHRHHTMAAANS